jgi:hemerythrin-like metal-binding protein
MPLITWTPALSVGIKEIDEQHQELVRLINNLHDAMKIGQGNAILGETLSRVLDYTVHHFGTEERLFKQTGYAGGVSHIAEHRQLTQQVQALKNKMDAGQAVPTIDLMAFLRDWLTDHIKGVDKKYTAFMHSKGIQ